MQVSERKELVFTWTHRSELSPFQMIPIGLLWQFISGRLEIQLGPLRPVCLMREQLDATMAEWE